MLYFFITEDNRYLKVGYSKNPQSRLRKLQTGSPLLLRILKVIPGSLELEAFFHRLLSPNRVHGEWFTLDEYALEIITAVN
jgi:hypothetical protein